MTSRTDATLWMDGQEGLETYEGNPIMVEAARTDVDEVAIHTFYEGRGSVVSIYFSRERAIEFATALLNESKVGNYRVTVE